MTKTPEEKAREYAEARYGNETIMSDVRGLTEEIFLDGYHSRDEEVKELREALKELTVSIDTIYRNYESGHIEGLFNSLTNAWAYCIEAKQLLKEE